MENDAISRSALIEQIRLMANRSSLGETRPPEISGIEVVGLIINSPALDVAPVVHASLRETGYDEAYCNWGDCTKCGCSNIFGSKYCYNCGARMDGEKNAAD